MTEANMTLMLAAWIRTEHPDVPFRVDVAADIPLAPRHRARVKSLHGKWSRGYPDLFIATTTKKFGGLYLELKVGDKVPNTEHTRRQAEYHKVLRKNGYKAEFCCGLADCKKKINKYLIKRRLK